MPNDKLRRRLAFEAARLIYLRQETGAYRAVLRASKKMVRGWIKPNEFPSDVEIRMEVQKLAWLHEGDARFDNARETYFTALEVMRRFEPFHPRLVGSAVKGRVRHTAQIEIHVFVDHADSIAGLAPVGLSELRQAQRSTIRKGAIQTHQVFEWQDRFRIRTTCFPSAWSRRVLRKRSTGRKAPQATLRQLEAIVRRKFPDAAEQPVAEPIDRFEIYRMLLAPLAGVEQHKKRHPEGDALYHSLQVFELAKNELPYDEEFLLAALLHDVGKALDPKNHIEAGLGGLRGHVTDRTAWLIENHTDGHRLLDGTLGERAKRRLRQSPDYDELLALVRCDRRGRVPGGEAPEVEEALDYIRDVARMCGE